MIAHCKATFQNMVVSYIEHKAIKATLLNVKVLLKVIEALIILAIDGTFSQRCVIFVCLCVTKLFVELGCR
jgi:ribosomal protein L17